MATINGAQGAASVLCCSSYSCSFFLAAAASASENATPPVRKGDSIRISLERVVRVRQSSSSGHTYLTYDPAASSVVAVVRVAVVPRGNVADFFAIGDMNAETASVRDGSDRPIWVFAV